VPFIDQAYDMTLQASGLTLARGKRKLFADLNFEIQPGDALRVAGPNGSGKTSLLRVLCGLAEPRHGVVPLSAQRDAFHQGLIYIGHGSGIKDELTACENVQTSALLAGRACTRAQAMLALDQMGLSGRGHLPARVLSQGQRRRVVLAGLALRDAASLLILDEPFNALDQASVQVLSSLIGRHLAAGAMLVYTTHQDQVVPAGRHREIELGLEAAGAV
jgi:heme exporter protein A